MNKKRQKIGTRLAVVVAIAVLITALATFLTTFFMLDSVVNETDEARAADNLETIVMEVDGIKDTVALETAIIANDSTIVEGMSAGLSTGDYTQLKNCTKMISEGVDFSTDKITYIDANGTVVLRYYSDEKGDSMADKGYFKKAIGGEANTDVTKGNAIPIGARCAYPIKDATGTIIGVASITYDLTNETFLDELKGDSDREYTIFLDNTRVNTTLLKDDGTRMVGTDMADNIAKVVLEEHKDYYGKATINNKSFIVAYRPIMTEGGDCLGAFFSGVNAEDIDNSLMIAIFIGSGIALFAVVLSIVIVVIYVNRNLSKPIGSLVKVANDMAAGNLNTEVGKAPNNEVGELADAIRVTLDNMKMIIDDISTHMNLMADGDLTTEVTRDYVGDFQSIKTAINKIAKALNGTLTSIDLAAEQVNAGADQVANSAQALSQGATEQASSIEELSGSIMSVSEQVSENAKNVNTAGTYVAESERGIENSSKYMEQMMQAMNDISESSAEISKVIKVIDDIAFQTNILALNAAVEAARAGAAGKGFSVVADEVRNLASKSAEAVKQTTVLIEGAVSSAQKGVEIAGQTSSALESVKSQSEKIVDIIQQVQKASNEQAEAINQITIGVEQISSVVQTNSATSEESAAAAEELSGQARMLQEEVSRFKLNKNAGMGGGMDTPSVPGGSGSDPFPPDFTIDLDGDKY